MKILNSPSKMPTEIKNIPMIHLTDVHEEDKNPYYYAGRLEELPNEFQDFDSSHRHSYYALFYFTEGEGIHSIDFHSHTITENSLFFLRPGQVHSWTFSKPVKGFALKIYPDYLSEHGGQVTSFQNYPFFQLGNENSKLIIQDADQFKKDFERLLEEKNTKSDSSMTFLLIQLVLQQSLKEFNSSFTDNVTVDSKLWDFFRLLENHFKDQKTTSYYAKQMGTSSGNLNQLCQKQYGKSAKSIIQERLVLEIKRLLIHSDLNINQIALTLGFIDSSYFSKFFKNHTDNSPENFRRLKRKLP
ncbi:helix-turn-helix domain-containing protein [Leptospira congkakensis]|uniref:Helix-turn-helix domain-containing protein n=1 Tax=Leptospira congkakensis TaxID=2484932 RepID=A0A4Z1AER4_9LEPT|nr:AraC family transcriptional regulator [Leptospira congkakensis]TGL86476.1 helix-turn-helix domain-containing protein [Leptospira congkakensis]TGL93978.1 helix-turn-helix domain-containing protein [Leptospira congkakensis]TGL94616.1 helix-turn-helix domain-containing protein [Leptospira congkakensis]